MMKRRMIAFILVFTMVWSSLGDLSFRGNYAQAEEEVPAGTSENQETLEMAVSEAEDPEADNPSVEEQTGDLSETGQETPVEAVPATPSEPVSETPAGGESTGVAPAEVMASESVPVGSSDETLTEAVPAAPAELVEPVVAAHTGEESTGVAPAE